MARQLRLQCALLMPQDTLIRCTALNPSFYRQSSRIQRGGKRRVINPDVEFFSHRWLQVCRRRQTVLCWIYSGQWRT
ncbi:hypothetical protein GDO81_022495 [Engystomops pustulosus]|uniref:Uncharacterized protein n=1 Tax=Engystomops pustulosus TaxID=76066 RepID=A0AAV6YM58_ENGPU|nr:hypothetical protein GDO81_022495 [Engystomops pustulosus]